MVNAGGIALSAYHFPPANYHSCCSYFVLS